MLKDKKVCLRGLELEDVDIIMKYWNNWELRRYLMIIHPNSRQEEEEFVKNTWRAREEKKGYDFGIELIDEKLLIGTVGVHAIDWINRTAVYGIAIWSKQYWKRGFGTEATKLILKFAFEQLNLNRIELRVFSYNERAQKMYAMVGFKQIGRCRKSIFRDGLYHDELIMDILQEEWNPSITHK